MYAAVSTVNFERLKPRILVGVDAKLLVGVDAKLLVGVDATILVGVDAKQT